MNHLETVRILPGSSRAVPCILRDITSEEEAGMFGKGWRVGRIAGFDIRVDLSWVLIAAVIALGFVARTGGRR